MLPFDQDQPTLNRTSLDDETLLSGQFWGELRVFLAVAKAKSFNRAAEILNTSQPTVSRHVKRLQDVVGSQLFISTQHGIKLTQKGDELAKALTRLDHALFSLTNDLKAETKAAEGLVRVSVTEGLNAAFVAPSLQQFADRYPRIQVHLKNPVNMLNLRENQTDMMIGFGPAESSDIRFRKLGQLHFIPVVTKEYINQYGLPTRSNLDKHVFLQSEYYSGKTGVWDEWNQMVARGRVAHYSDNSFAYVMLIKAGLGIGLLGSYMVVEPAIVPLELDLRIPIPLYLAALAERLNARPVRLVFDWLGDVFGNDNPWFNEDFKLDNPPSAYDAGLRNLFNIRVGLMSSSR
jgi:DNA-binding transcriptional LysR family regulator